MKLRDLNIFGSSKKIELEKAKIDFANKRLEEQIKERAFAAAQITRLTNDWQAVARAYNFDIRQGLSALRSRARDLYQNDPYSHKLANSYAKNIVGPYGFSFRGGAGDYVKGKDGKYKFVLDQLANLKLREGFLEWSKKENCSITGQFSLTTLLTTFVKSMVVDGEAIFRMIKNPKANKFGFTLQVIEPEYLDERTNRALPNGGYVIMGVEYDKNHKRVAYWFRKKDTMAEINGFIGVGNDFEVVPADQVIHAFLPDVPYQVRGVSVFAPMAIRLKMLYGFEEAALIRSRATANVPFFMERKDGGNPQLTGDKADENGNQIEEIEQGEIYRVPDGWQAKNLPNEFPHQMHPSFTEVILHGIAAGGDVAFPTVSANYKGMNYTVSRTALLDERDTWEGKQQFFIEHVLVDIYSKWLEMALLTQRVQLPDSKYSKFNQPNFIARKWKWVDIKAEGEAHLQLIENKLETLEDYFGEKGIDIEEHFDQLDFEAEMIQAYEKKWKMPFFIPRVHGADPNELAPLDTAEGAPPVPPGNATEAAASAKEYYQKRNNR